MIEQLRSMAGELSARLGYGDIIHVNAEPLSSDEQGFSGAAMLRLKVVHDNGTAGSFICKRTDLKERMVMKTLTQQGRGHTPAAYSADCSADAPMWMVQQDLGRREAAPRGDARWIDRVAGALADIHADNMNRGADMPWLPHADAAYWQKIATQISIDHFERMTEESREFARRFGQLLPRLRSAGERFAREMSALYAESDWLTLTHGDLQTIDGDHVYCVNGHPSIIDFGFARYAPFYIDLVDYFSLEDATAYHRALLQKELALPWNDFEERFRTAASYPGFIYLYPGLMQWTRGSDERLQRALGRILG